MKINKTEILKKYKNLSIDDVNSLIDILNELKDRKSKEKIFIDDLINKAKDNGIDVNDLILMINSKKNIQKTKYQKNINGVIKSYSGKGKKPSWITEYLESGGKLEDIEVK